MRADQPAHAEAGSDSVAHTLRVIAIVAATVLLIWLLSDIVLLIFMALLFAVMLRGASDWAAWRLNISSGKTLTAVTLLLLMLAIGLVYYIGPKLVSQSEDLWSQVSQQVTQLQHQYGDTAWGRIVFHHLSPTGSESSAITSYAKTIATSTIGSIATAFILIVTALYFAISPELYVEGSVRLFPLPYRARARKVMHDVGRSLQRWSLGQLIDMLVVGVLTGIGLTLLGIPMPLALGVVAGLFTFVPYFGAIAAAVPAMLVALNVGWQASLWVLVIFLCCHGIEGYIVGPLVQRRTVRLPPALTILSMTIFGTVFGPLGIILGTPIAAALLVIVQQAYVGGVLQDPDEFTYGGSD